MEAKETAFLPIARGSCAKRDITVPQISFTCPDSAVGHVRKREKE